MVINSSITCPKKTLTSQKWMRRNDSTSVSTLLQSSDSICKAYKNNKTPSIEEDSNDSNADSDDEQPRRVILSEPQKTETQHKIYKTFCPDCYCKSFPVAPCMGKPRDSCCCTQAKPKIRCKTAYVQNIAQPRRSQGTQFDRCQTAGRYTKRRESYETKSKDYFTTLKQRVEELEREVQREQEEMDRKQLEYRHLQERTQYRDIATQNCAKKCGESKQTKIKDLMSFRKSHYFACHSSATSLDNPVIFENKKETGCTNSTCVHKCFLSNNLKISAENPDEYGISRCKHCKKSLSEATLSNPPNFNSRSLLFEKASLKNLNLVPIVGENSDNEEFQLQDKMFLTTRNNEQLEVTLPHNFLQEVQKPLTLSMLTTKTFKNFKVPVPTDSMALRFQKGMINKTIGSYSKL